MFFLEYYDMLSGGALGALFVGLVTCATWEKGWPRCASAGPNSTYAPDIERVVAKVRAVVTLLCLCEEGLAALRLGRAQLNIRARH